MVRYRAARGAYVFRRREITVHFVFRHVEHDDFIGMRGALDVELHRLVGRLVFFLDGLIVRDDHQGVFEFLGVRFRQRDLNGADVRGRLGPGQVQFKDVAFP